MFGFAVIRQRESARIISEISPNSARPIRSIFRMPIIAKTDIRTLMPVKIAEKTAEPCAHAKQASSQRAEEDAVQLEFMLKLYILRTPFLSNFYKPCLML